MKHSLHLLTQIKDCDALLSFATERKCKLEFKKFGDEIKIHRMKQLAAQLEISFNEILKDIFEMKRYLEACPEWKDDQGYRLHRLEHKKLGIENSRAKLSVAALLEQEISLALIDREIVELDELIKSIEKMKHKLAA